MKKVCALILLVSFCLSGCSVLAKYLPIQRGEEDTVQLPEMMDTTPETELPEQAQNQQPVQTEPAQTQPTQPVCYPVWAEDEYAESFNHPYGSGKYCVHIPNLYWNGQECGMRDQIYFDHMGQIESAALDGQPMYSAAYSLGQNDRMASLVTYFNSQDYAYWKYSIFHVDLSTGREASDGQVLEAFGYDYDRFYAEVRQIAQKRLETTFRNFGEDGSAVYQEMLEQQISDETIHAARPYVDESGKLCAVVMLMVPAGAGKYPECIGLQSPDNTAVPASIRCNQQH